MSDSIEGPTQWMTLPLSEVIHVNSGFWVCLLCAQPGRPGLGRHWSTETHAAAVQAGIGHLQARHHLREPPPDYTTTLTQTDIARRLGVALSTVSGWRRRYGPGTDHPFPRSDAPPDAVDYWYAARWPEIEAWRQRMLDGVPRKLTEPWPPAGFVTASGAGVWIGKPGTWVLRCPEFPTCSKIARRGDSRVPLWAADRQWEVLEWYAVFAPKSKRRTVNRG